MSKIKILKAIAGVALLMGFSNLSAAGPITFGVFSNNATAGTAAGSIVTAQGNTATTLATLTAANLLGIDVLWALNRNNSAQLPGLAGSVLDDFVSAGGVLLYHDRRVTGADGVLPGATTTSFVRAVANSVDVVDATTTLTNGPGGVIGDTTLDFGDSSRHGYATLGTLPTNSTALLSTGDSSQIVDFTYSFGLGSVHYSTIPLDFYLEEGATAFRDIYAPNVAAYAAELVSEVSSPATLALLGLGLAGLGWKRRKQA